LQSKKVGNQRKWVSFFLVSFFCFLPQRKWVSFFCLILFLFFVFFLSFFCLFLSRFFCRVLFSSRHRLKQPGLLGSGQHDPEIARRGARVESRRWRTDRGRCACCVRHLTPEGDGRRTQRRVGRERAAMAVPPGRRPICEQAAPRDGRSTGLLKSLAA